MKIKFLKRYQENQTKFKNRVTEPKGLSYVRISELEEEINNTFPKAYKEFLFIGGEYSALGLDDGEGLQNGEWVPELLNYFLPKARKAGIVFDRPIAIFNQLDGDAFTFIYLDEGDNPKVWNCGVHPDYRDDNGDAIYPNARADNFKDYIDDLVDSAVKEKVHFSLY